MKNNPNIPSQNIFSLDIYRKALSEFKNDVYLNIDWQANLSTTMASYKSAIDSGKLKGYIQNFEKDGQVQITIFSELQLDCLNKTPYCDRILHVDATGSQVKIKKQHIRQDELCCYNRILNYYLLVKT